MSDMSKLVIKQQLKHDNTFLKGALLLIWRRQTDVEQESHSTDEANGVGFNKADAMLLSPLAEKVSSGGALTVYELKVVRDRMLKYVTQLDRIMMP